MSTSPQGALAEAAALDAYVKLMRAAEAVTARAHVLLAGSLTLTQFGVLEALYHRGALCAGELADKILKSAGNITLVISNLERDGLVSKARDPADARRWIISLTPAGRERITLLFPQIAAALTHEFAVLSPGEQVMLGEICKKLGRGRDAPSS